MVSLGDIAVAYRSDIEQLLVLFPQGTAVMSSIILPNSNTKQDYKGVYLDFNLNLNLPPPCNTGFLPVRQQRSPSEQDAPERPAGELYCRVPQESDLNVRGVRNIPCETVPGKRAPTVEMCKATSSTSHSMTVTTGRATPTRHCPARVCRSTGRGLIRACRHRRIRVRRSRLREPPPPVAPPIAAVPYDPATGDYIGPDGKPYTQSNLRIRATRPGSRCWSRPANSR